MTSSEANDVSSSRLQWLAAGLSMLAGIVHFLVSGQYLSVWWGYGFFFICAGISQIAYAPAIFVQPLMYPAAGPGDSGHRAVMRRFHLAGAVGNAAIIGLYIITRTVGIPAVGPAAHVVDSVTLLSLATTAAEVVLVAILLQLARRSVPGD